MKFKIGQYVEMEDGSRGQIEEILITSDGTWYGVMKSWGVDDLVKEDTINAVCEHCGKIIKGVSTKYCSLRCRNAVDRDVSNIEMMTTNMTEKERD